MTGDDLAAAKASGWAVESRPKTKESGPTSRQTCRKVTSRATFDKYVAVPASMKQAKRWVTWQYEIRDGKKTKVPHTPGKGRASSTDPATWVSFEAAVQAEQFYSGIGFVLGDGWLGLDADHVRDPDTGAWVPGILDEIRSVQSYAEVSPSGSGAHVITYGTKPGDRCRAKGEVWEMYEDGRYFTVTGDHIPGTPDEVHEPAPGSLEAIYEKIGRSKTELAPGDRPAPRPATTPDLTDEEVVEKCRNAANAAKFNALWRGDTAGYASGSEADLALCNILAFYTQDPAQLERLVRQSGLYREKWDRTDYVIRTISAALQACRETWSPGRRDQLKTHIEQKKEDGAKPGEKPERPEDLGALPPREIFSSIHPKTGTVSLSYIAIADWIMATLKTITYRRTVYVYDPERGIYRENDGDIEQIVQEIATRCGFAGRISTAKREVISYILDMEIARDYPFNAYPGVPCTNGVVVFDFEKGTCALEPHSPEQRFTYRLPVAYDPAADPAEIRRVLASWVDEGDYTVLLQIPAQALIQSTVTGKPFKKSYIIYGDTNGGKSSYIELNRRTFGSENIARVMLQQIGNDRFCLANLEGKLFNIYDDLDDVPLQNSSVLKAITGDDTHYVERKGIDAYEARIFAVHIYTCNRPPSTPERVQNDAAFWGRWEFITFSNYFEVNPKWYDLVLTPATCSAYLNLVLEMAISIYQAGDLPVKSSACEVRENWQTNSDPIYKFVTENMDRSEAGYILKDDAYAGFLKFARAENVPPSKIPGTLETFAKAVFKYGFAPARVRADGTRVYVFRGYVWKTTSQYKPGGATNATLQGGA
ncbi:MAG: hypothetical protein GX837_06645 [Methanomicrobiales archaeon]|nr:hypothetical protein [Methanomicrobiales archaeon]